MQLNSIFTHLTLGEREGGREGRGGREGGRRPGKEEEEMW
jgi:hypothetical protein